MIRRYGSGEALRTCWCIQSRRRQGIAAAGQAAAAARAEMVTRVAVVAMVAVVAAES